MDSRHINDYSDAEISQKMIIENYEKFKTLVRMHLSFELDLNTDEFDLPSHEVIYYDKGKMRKWNGLCKKVKNNSLGRASCNPLTVELIEQLRTLKNFILQANNIIQEGIFRKTGSVSRQNELRTLIHKREPFDLSTGYTTHDCATVYKSFLAELPEPLLTDAHYPAHCQIADLCNGTDKDELKTDNTKQNHVLSIVKLLLLLLPDENRLLLEDLIEMLHSVITHEPLNKMSSENLATLFAPHLICPRNLPPEALHYVCQNMSSVISLLIKNGPLIFEIPPKLATDIRAYFLEQKRKKTMSPEHTLDESISDLSTVNTVYTFVDREKTAAALSSNNTDTELAQLYAHIQSLPESSKKRRLIKQFNKQNGQGTPLQLLNRKDTTSRSAKSIGDSIKKHIFHKSIMSRTPKRSGSVLGSFGTPNGATKYPKLRVLFQSPIPCTSSNTSSSPLSSASSTSAACPAVHPLQKSISSSSLLTSSSAIVAQQSSDYSEINSNIHSKKIVSISAPVSRTSSDLTNFVDGCSSNSSNDGGNISETPHKIIVGAAKQLQRTSNEKKNVAWNDENLFDYEEYSNPCTPNNKQNSINKEMRSRYKSEPNLSRILLEKNMEETTVEKYTRSFTQKIIKGVSMGNLRFSFTPESTKRLRRSTSLIKRKISCEDSDTDSIFQNNIEEESKDDDDPSDNDEDEDQNQDEIDSITKVDYCSSSHNLNLYRNLNLITSTPSLLLGRRSMSPITKSTQRMPKAMQESIMTPRSRKPVMMLTTTTISSSEQNQTVYQNDLSSFREQDEDSFLSQNLTPKGSTSLSYDMQDNTNLPKEIHNKNLNAANPGALTDTFKEYLLSRSVLTASPVDSSFSSQPDDFGSTSTSDLQNLDESQLSPSLLFCLNGNQPDENYKSPQRCDSETQKIQISNTRKRSSSSSTTIMNNKNDDTNSYDSIDTDDNYTKTKKLLIIRENPGETIF